MVQRHTPLATVFRAYTAGGARSMIDTIDDNKQMQESTNAGGMASEDWPTMESPQNYGFTSVVADADKGQDGKISDCAEGFISFMGGNRSFPVMGIMDDRRHRLMNLAKDAAKGATAMFGLKKWGQQLLNTEDGWFMTGNTEKKMRLQLVKNKNDQQGQQGQQQGGGGGASTFAAEGGGGGTSGGDSGQQGGQQRGQKTLHKEESETFVDMTKNAIQTRRGDGYMNVTKDISQTYHKEKNHDTRCDSNHVHIGWIGNKIWVDGGGCWSSQPIQLKNCNDGSTAASATEHHYETQSGPPAYFAAPPMQIDTGGHLSMAVAAPLAIEAPTEEHARAIHRAAVVGDPRPEGITNGKLRLDLDRSLVVTEAGKLALAPTLRFTPQAFADLPDLDGAVAYISDSTTVTVGSAVSGGGTAPVLAVRIGGGWKVLMA